MDSSVPAFERFDQEWPHPIIPKKGADSHVGREPRYKLPLVCGFGPLSVGQPSGPQQIRGPHGVYKQVCGEI